MALVRGRWTAGYDRAIVFRPVDPVGGPAGRRTPMAAVDRGWIGRTSQPTTVVVEAGAVRRFADAIGDPDPLYRDGEFARGVSQGPIQAPPTFAVALATEVAGLDIPLEPGLVHGEQEFIYRRPLYVGDVLTLQTEIKDVYEKQGRSGRLKFIVRETVATDQQGAEVVRFRTVSIVRPV